MALFMSSLIYVFLSVYLSGLLIVCVCLIISHVVFVIIMIYLSAYPPSSYYALRKYLDQDAHPANQEPTYNALRVIVSSQLARNVDPRQAHCGGWLWSEVFSETLDSTHSRCAACLSVCVTLFPFPRRAWVVWLLFTSTASFQNSS